MRGNHPSFAPPAGNNGPVTNGSGQKQVSRDYRNQTVDRQIPPNSLLLLKPLFDFIQIGQCPLQLIGQVLEFDHRFDAGQ